MIETRNASYRNAECLESEAARKLHGISPKTWQNYRDQRVIPFSQIGRKIYVNRTVLDTFLRRHRIEGNNIYTSFSQQFMGSGLC